MKPQLSIDLLLSFGAVCNEYEKGKVLFHEGEEAAFYYQLVYGSVKM